MGHRAISRKIVPLHIAHVAMMLFVEIHKSDHVQWERISVQIDFRWHKFSTVFSTASKLCRPAYLLNRVTLSQRQSAVPESSSLVENSLSFVAESSLVVADLSLIVSVWSTVVAE